MISGMIKDFYKVDSVTRHDDGAVYRVSLNPDCEVYKGHFPGNPVSPGVCGIQMIRECAEMECSAHRIARKLMIREVQQCKFTSLISPVTCPQVDVSISVSEDASGEILLKSSVVREGTVCLTLKAICVESR